MDEMDLVDLSQIPLPSFFSFYSAFILVLLLFFMPPFTFRRRLLSYGGQVILHPFPVMAPGTRHNTGNSNSIQDH